MMVFFLVSILKVVVFLVSLKFSKSKYFFFWIAREILFTVRRGVRCSYICKVFRRKEEWGGLEMVES